MGDPMWRYYLGVLFIACEVISSRGMILESIYWNTTNTKFVPGQGLVLYPQIGDKMDIVCPRVDGGVADGVEYYKIHMVPREQLESCTITKADTPLLNCVKPDQDVKFTLKFQEFSPNLWGLEFFRGTDYYIISTSNGTMEGLENSEGGVCKMKSMKIIMKVGQSPSDSAPPKDNPTRYPPKYPDTKVKDPLNPNDVLKTPGRIILNLPVLEEPVCVCVCMGVCVSVCVCLSQSLSVSPCPFLSFPVSPCLTLSLPPSLPVLSCLSLSLLVSPCLSR
ncbi:hypothetical protein DPEC_G00137690 [Dallia pectoralis]|uniref:Uncharacterized protein n=1 Tax=Dallia pectoralis TaxID=75939 RepID=A0ACC2GLF8_DALPE|nr:hypothetical protein DPEC_G00137690 [Dallia pectoralis]